jgi:hypothetical protein
MIDPRTIATDFAFVTGRFLNFNSIDSKTSSMKASFSIAKRDVRDDAYLDGDQ